MKNAQSAPGVLIRGALPEDAPVITSNNRAMAKETEGRTLDLEMARKGVETLISDPSKGFYVLAESSGQTVGQCMITFEWSDWRCGDFWWIQSVYILPGFRGQGILTRMYQHVLAMAGQREDVVGLRLYVDKGNRSAQEIYEHLGLKRSHYEMHEIEFHRKQA